jgi:hypothetical protein
VNWFLALAALVVVGLSLAFYMRRRTAPGVPAKGRQESEMEASTEIGVPREEVDPQKALHRDRLFGVERPKVGGRKALGALKDRVLRKDNLSKEVELAWEAAETIEFQPGAYAWPRDFIDDDRRARAEDRERSPVHPKTFREEEYFLPERYGKDRLVLMVRDPQWIYAYWEVTHDKYRQAMEKHMAEWGLSRPALRLYDITPGIPRRTYLDVLVAENAGDWYVHVDRPRHTLVAELGRLHPGGFIPLLRSNPITLPPKSYAMEAALEWSDWDWERLYGRGMGEYYASSPMAWRP